MKFKFEVKYIPLIFLSLFLTKCLLLGFDWTSVGFLLVLGAINGFYELKNYDKKVEDFNKEIQILHKRFELTDKHLTEFAKELSSAKEVTDTWKLNTQIRSFKTK